MDVEVHHVHHVKVRALGSTIDVFVDDMAKPKISSTDSTYTSGMDSVRVFDTGATFDNVQILPLSFRDDFGSGNMDRWNIR